MARITDNQLSSLKTDISLIRLIESQGHNLSKDGKDYKICCPFHEDATPSLKISTLKNVYHCFGCDAKGTVIDWVMQTQGVSFRHACEILADGAGMNLSGDVVKKSTVQKLASPLTSQVDNQTVLNQVINYYHETLKTSPDALAYLKSRGLDNSEVIDTFKLGYANRTLGLRIPAKNRIEGKKMRSQLQEIGIYRKSGHEHFNGSIVVPIIDNSDGKNVVEVYARKIRDDLRKGTPKHLYLPGQHSGIFNQQCLQSSDEVILCESLIDALTFWNYGFRNVTTSYGTSGFTEDILQAFKTNNIKRVLIAYDRDEAGNKAAVELSKKLNKESIDTYRILFPKNMDCNEYALNVTPAEQSLSLVIRKATWMGKGKEPANKRTENKIQITEKKELAKGESLSSLASSTVIPEPPARIIPEAGSTTKAEVSDHEVNITFGESPTTKRKYRIRGLAKNMSYEQLKLNIHVSKEDNYHIDTFDLYHAKARASYIKTASLELGHDVNVIKKDLGKILVKLEELQEAQINATLNVNKKSLPTLSEEQYSQAMELLKSPNLLKRITQDLTSCGIIGEDTNKLTGYLACVSRKLDRPLAIIIQSTSAAGKSSLMDAILNLMPEEELTQYSAMTGQSLFYMGETSLKHKILAIAEEEGAQNASYALKLLQSEGKLTIASTGKDETSGNMETKEYHVEGPVMLFLTTTAIDIDEELMNRCLVLTVNESREQTQAIHDMQRSMHTIDGILAKQSKNKLIELHQNAQRLIQPFLVANPYAEELTFINDKTRTRRDHMKYLTLINSITLLHQHQREIKTVNHQGEALSYIEVTKSDIAMANKLAHEILGRSLDELPPQTRTLLNHINEMVIKQCKIEGIEQNDYRFSRREVREYCGWTDFQIKKHITRLQDMEYLLIHRGGRGQSFVYELLYNGEGKDGNNFVLGLKNMGNYNYDTNKEPQKVNKESPSSAQVAPKVPRSSISKNTPKPNNTNDFEQINGKTIKNTRPKSKKTSINHVVHA
jgi:DNA primase catalytic core